MGTILLVEEDRNTDFAGLLTRYFVAEGVACAHKTAVFTTMKDAAAFYAKLPYVSAKSKSDKPKP